MFKAPGILHNYLPAKNKYTNFKDIETYIFEEVGFIHLQRFLNLIKYNYLQNKENIFMPEKNNIVPYFTGHSMKSFLSLYYKENNILDNKTDKIITDKKIIGAMTSRPVSIKINNGSEDAEFKAYYVDYLCVDKQNRKKGIAPQLIQTHHYNQRHLNKSVVVSLFKREHELTGIVPLCVYSTFGFPVTTWTKPTNLSSEYKILEINPQNYYLLLDFIKINNSKFDIIINADVGNIIELIKTKNIFIYTIICDGDIICAYYFRKSCVQIEKNMEVLTCFASLSNTNDTIFVKGFKIIFWKIAAENMFGFAAIENISYNHIIIDDILLKTRPLIISPTAYFFYNFAYPTFHSNKVFIIN
jgi:ribosomal protein S18 acetylase RimI-like enzyme